MDPQLSCQTVQYTFCEQVRVFAITHIACVFCGILADSFDRFDAVFAQANY
jgi:hypothetical protein